MNVDKIKFYWRVVVCLEISRSNRDRDKSGLFYFEMEIRETVTEKHGWTLNHDSTRSLKPTSSMLMFSNLSFLQFLDITMEFLKYILENRNWIISNSWTIIVLEERSPRNQTRGRASNIHFFLENTRYKIKKHCRR